jgi:hypothetical protein
VLHEHHCRLAAQALGCSSPQVPLVWLWCELLQRLGSGTPLPWAVAPTSSFAHSKSFSLSHLLTAPLFDPTSFSFSRRRLRPRHNLFLGPRRDSISPLGPQTTSCHTLISCASSRNHPLFLVLESRIWRFASTTTRTILDNNLHLSTCARGLHYRVKLSMICSDVPVESKPFRTLTSSTCPW